MADVRTLLRQQRAARRIEHPHAAYSDAGKLLCTVCHEHVKAESLWDGHIRGAGHRQRLQTLQQYRAASETSNENGHTGDGNTFNGGGGGLKRKLDDENETMENSVAADDPVRKKRSKPDMTLGEPGLIKSRDDRIAAAGAANHKPITPPALMRRQSSSTPTLGVEMQIPSRPATPGAMPQSAGGSSAGTGGGTSAATTPKTAGLPFGRSPLIPQEQQHHLQPSNKSLAAGTTTPTPEQFDSATVTPAPPVTTTAAAVETVDDDVWAAFEADLVHGGEGSSAAAVAAIKGVAVDEGAVISAPAMSAAELAAKSQEEEEVGKRRAAADIEIEDEREDATRALETEFEVMEELEARARKLRERREALRLQNATGGGVGSGSDDPTASATKTATVAGFVSTGKENATVAVVAADAQNEEDEDDEDDEEEADDWVGFRFRS